MITYMVAPNAILRGSQVLLVVQNPPAKAGDVRHMGLIPESGRYPGGGLATQVCVPGESYGQRSLEGYKSIRSQRVGHD